MDNSDNSQKVCSPYCFQYYYYKDNLDYCIDKCPENTIIDQESKYCLSKIEECKKIISRDGRFCKDSCQDDEFIIIGQFKQCQLGCSDFQYSLSDRKYCREQCPWYLITDRQKHKCYEKKEECKDVISSDGIFCDESCKENEYLMSEGSYMKCLASCDYFYYQYEKDGKRYCAYECPENMAIDNVHREKKCHADINGCRIAASDDEKSCIESCNSTNREVIVSKRCIICTDYYLVEEKSCQKQCLEGQITDKDEMLCFKSKKYCKGFLSLDGTQCLRKCDSQNKEVAFHPYFLWDVQQCEVCLDYFTEGKYGASSTCNQECGDGQIAIIPLKICTMNMSDCLNKNYIMSADGRSCNINCKYPEILKEEKCISKDDCTGDNEIIDETIDPIECKNKADHAYSCYLQSSDGRRCVHSCLANQIERQLPPPSSSYQCEDCKPPEIFFIIIKENKEIGVCRESISLRETSEILVFNLENSKTVEDFEQVKVGITDFVRTQYESNPPEPSELLQTFKASAKQFFSALLKDNLSSVKYNVHCIGSRSNALVCLQLIDKGRSIQKSFIVESILRESPLDLTEISNRTTDLDSSGILLFIFSNSSLCKKASCKNFPVVLVESINLRGEGNLSVKGLGLRAIFTMNQPLGQYLCQHYDDDLTQLVDKSFPQTNKITLACPLDNPTSVETDDNCFFSLDRSTCGFSVINWSIRASSKVSVLICVGIYVFIA